MKKISFEKVLEITGGKLIQGELNGFVENIRIDSRLVEENDLYIPIVGENNNGHDFIKALKNGKISLSQEMDRKFPDEMTIIQVDSTFKALQALAGYNRHLYQIPVVAITGSSGKTTTKDLVATVLEQKFKILKTEGNLNNEYGIPRTLLELDDSHEIAVVEMGMDHLGDIEKSIALVEPELSVITNIGLTHIEILKTQENIFKAKKEILQTLKNGDTALINGDDIWLSKIKDEIHDYEIKTFGAGKTVDIHLIEYLEGEAGLSMLVEYKGEKETYQFRFPGKHNAYNCLVGIFIGKCYGLSQEEIQHGLNAFKPSKNRMDIFDYKDIKVINDSYNANPDAMQAALDVLDILSAGKRRRIAVLGDMLEMGEYGPPGHFQVGEYARQKADMIFAIGALSREIARGFNQEENTYLFDTAEAAKEQLKKIVSKGDVVLIKGSRGIHLERLVEAIREGE